MPEVQTSVRLKEPVLTAPRIHTTKEKKPARHTSSKMSVRSDKPGASTGSHLMKTGSVHRKLSKTPAVSEKSSKAPAQPPQKQNSKSLWSLMAARTLAHRFVQRFRREHGYPEVARHKPPTYQLGPTKKFDEFTVKPIIKDVIENRMKTFRYTPTTANILCKLLSSECKEAIKKLNYDRYKIIVHITIGEKKEQTMALCSRCVWDTSVDNQVSYNWEGPSSFCSTTVYAVYYE